MKKLFTLIIAFTILFLCASPTAGFAMSCMMPNGKGRVEKYPVIFRGVATDGIITSLTGKLTDAIGMESMGTNFVSTYFDVTKTYKGKVGDSVRISGGRFVAGDEYIIYTNEDHDVSFCTPETNLTQANKQDYMHEADLDGLILLEDYKAKAEAKNSDAELELRIQGIDSLISYFKSFSFKERFYDHKGQIYEDHNKFIEAKNTYELFIKLLYEDIGKRFAAMKSGTIDPIFLLGAHCDLLAPVTSDTPFFLKPFPPNGYFVDTGFYFSRKGKILMHYGRVLYKLGKYQEALRPLCIAVTDPDGDHTPETAALKTLALIQLGRVEQIGDEIFHDQKVKRKKKWYEIEPE